MKIITGRRDVVWNFAGTIMSMASNFLLLPFLVAGLSGSDLGLWYVFTALGAFVMLFEFGFNPTFARNITYCWSGARELQKEGAGENSHADKDINIDLLAQLIAVSKRVYACITMLIAVILLIPGSAYLWQVSRVQWNRGTIIAWVLFVAATLVNMYYLYYAAMLRGIGCIAEDNKNKIYSRLTQLIISAILLLAGFGLIGAVLGYVAYVVFYRIYGYVLFWHNRAIRQLDLKNISVTDEQIRHVYKTISYNAYKDGAVMISNYGATQAGTVLCSLFLTLEQTGVYSIGLQLATALGNVSLAYLNSCRPAIQSAYQLRDNDSIIRIVGKSLVAYIIVFIIGFVLTEVLVYPLLSIIKPGSSFDPYLFIGLSIYIFIFDWIAFFSSILANFNTIPYMKAYVITAIVGLILCVLFMMVFHWGAWGLVLGMAIPQIFYNVWKWPLEASLQMNATIRLLLQCGLRVWFRALKAGVH